MTKVTHFSVVGKIFIALVTGKIILVVTLGVEMNTRARLIAAEVILLKTQEPAETQKENSDVDAKVHEETFVCSVEL